MSTIRERDAEQHSGYGDEIFPWCSQAEVDRHSLLAALDALVEAVEPFLPPEFPRHGKPGAKADALRAALATAKEAGDVR